MSAARVWAALAIGPVLAIAQGDFRAPQYSAGSITNAASNELGAYAPNTFVSIYGVDLGQSTLALSQGTTLQTNGPPGAAVQITLGLSRAYLFYVSPAQVNFLVPSNFGPGRVNLQLVRDGVAGPAVPITLAAAAPALFELRDRYALATTPEFTLVDSQHPAKGGDVVILWATGLGATVPPAPVETVPRNAAVLSDMGRFRVEIDGKPVEARNILYAGLAPGFAGLYQINLRLPENTPANPEVILEASGNRSPAGRKLFVR